jgi:TonB-linked SusC/RagA family outer membrane protein
LENEQAQRITMLHQMYNFYPKKLVQPPGYASKFLLTMKLTTVFLFVAIMQVSATTWAQKVSLSESGSSLKDVFGKISDQTGCDFLASSSVLNQAKPVTIRVENEDLAKVLEMIFFKQPLAYEMQGKIVVVIAKEADHSPNNSSNAQDIFGKVVDETARPLPGATIKLKGTNIVGITRADGTFNFTTSMQNPVLLISFIGYENQEYRIDSKTSFPLQITLTPLVGSLNQVQVIGYGTTTKRFNTGSTGTVTRKEIENQPVSNPLAALQGRISGVLVQTQNGLPGGGIKIQIRGQGSLASGTDPLYIVDGVPFLSTAIGGNGAAAGANGAVSPLSIINPGDIERIDILKDADATAIYGSRAANGVVLITTKKGAKGKETITVNMSEGVSRISRLNNPLLNLPEYLQLRREAFKNDGEVPDIYSAPDLATWDTTKSTNWQRYFYGGTAHVTNVQASLSGGDQLNQYLISGNYHREGTIFPGDESYVKGGGFFTFTHHSANNKFTNSTSINYNKDRNQTLYASINSQSSLLPPNFPIYNADGKFNWDIANPAALLLQKQESNSNYFNVNETLDYKLTSSWSVHLNAGYNNYQLHQIATLPLASQDPTYAPQAKAFFQDDQSEKYILEPQLNFNHKIGNGFLTALLGGTYQNQKSTGTFIEGDGISNPTLLGNLSAASIISNHSNTYSLYKYASVFSRINYKWQDKYLLDFNFRRDGSSRFGPDHQFGNFYAIGAAWIFSEEAYFKHNLPFISFGKLRSSIGTTGNDQINDYQYLASYGPDNIYAGISTLTPTKVANPNYSWETTHKFEVALELGLFSNRLMFTGAWYRHSSGNQLIDYKVPLITGFATYQANFPATIQNDGIELDLDARVIDQENFHWQTSINVTLPKNTLKSFPNLEGSSYAYSYVVGQDLNVYRGFHFLGVDPQTGKAKLEDVNHDGAISAPGDLVVLGKTSPDLYGGLSNEISWKAFEMDFTWEFVKRKYPGYQPLLGGYPQNDPSYVTKRWQKPGDITDIPRASIDLSISQYNSSQLSGANYARLKNVSVSYNMPVSLCGNLGIKALKVYLNGENLLVIANKQRFDPELSGNSIGIPPLKTLILGFKASL